MRLWPLLSIANRPVLILGVPALVLYLFAVWVAIAGILLAYLCFLSVVAAAAERFGRRLSAPRLKTATDVLAVSVYCTAWTFYGSVGLAANRGLEFLTIYLGPALIALLWPTVRRKRVRVAKEQRRRPSAGLGE